MTPHDGSAAVEAAEANPDNQVTFAEALTAHPALVYSESFLRRTANVAHQGITEFWHNSGFNKIIGALAVGAQAADRLRGSVVLIPTASIAVFENTQSVPLTALAGGGIFLGWSMIVGESYNQGLEVYPKSIESFNSNFPAITDFFTVALPGIEDQSTRADYKPDNPESRLKKIGRYTALRAKRALVAFYTGTSMFTGVAAANNYTKNERSRVNFDAAVDGSTFTFGLVGGTAFTVDTLADSGQPELAQDILNVIGDWKPWLGLSALLLYTQYRSSKNAKQKLLGTDDIDEL